MTSLRAKAGLLVLLALTPAIGCAVGPNYHRPKIETPASFRFTPDVASASSIADLPWWRVFRDGPLQVLLDKALENNLDLAVALARVAQARAQASAVGAHLLPTVGATGAVVYTNGSSHGGISLYGGGAQVSWEPDVFGGVRRSIEEARANAAASEENRRGVWLTVLADVAQGYFNLQSLDLQHQIAVRTIALRNETLDLYKTQLQGGVGTGLEVARAEADVYGAQATLADVDRRIGIGEDSISLLLGLAPGPVVRTPTTDALPGPPPVPVGLPSSLLARRPDIRHAEAQLMAANADIGVQTAKLFPTFPLMVTPSLSSIEGIPGVALGGWSYFLLGLANWTAPILGSPTRAQIDAAKAADRAAIASYRKAVLTALQEVSDALVALDRLGAERGREERQVTSLARAVEVSLSQVRGGTATYLDVVSAQELEFTAQLALAQLEGEQLGQYVQLYRSLGGGWWRGMP